MAVSYTHLSDDIAVFVIEHGGHEAVLRRCFNDTAYAVINIGNLTSVRINNLLYVPIPVIAVINISSRENLPFKNFKTTLKGIFHIKNLVDAL